MATDRASDSRLARQSKSDDSTNPSSRKSATPADTSRASSGTPAKPNSTPQSGQPKQTVLEHLRPEKKSLKEYFLSREGRLAAITYFISVVVHGLILMMLALVILKPELADDLFEISSSKIEEPIDELEQVFDSKHQPKEIVNQEFEDLPDLNIAQDLIEETQPLNIDISDVDPAVEIDENSLSSLAELAKEGEFGGRSAKGRQSLVKAQGGSEGSEAAVVRGLKWIADLQQADGSWNFGEIGESPDEGDFDQCEMGATGLSLMAFLGAGHTHMKDGPYKENVAEGLAYIMNNARIQPTGVDYRAPSNQGNMYVQGICVIALAEAFGMTKDRRLLRPVEGGVAFIINAQNATGGGWRYNPGDEGDTSVVGWQLMALISARHAGVKFPRNVFRGARAFLNRVEIQDDKHTWYGYNTAAKKLSTSAVGLLCRMYLGWDRKVSGLKKGVQLLADKGPSKGDDYYNYYATQVMHHWGGEPWTAWNHIMRDQLVKSQVKKGPAMGSWNPGTGHGPAQGGRLYTTCLNLMTLEVYYRHLPLYQRNSFSADL
ncbi:MAG: terpene cyclase/mutase family protein [Planctomycetaceae bacterium]|nr:terpene cyclase/mutase family protein [Planctomycetaceae bacterium]